MRLQYRHDTIRTYEAVMMGEVKNTQSGRTIRPVSWLKLNCSCVAQGTCRTAMFI